MVLSGPTNPVYGLEVRDGRIIVDGMLDITDAMVTMVSVEQDVADVIQVGGPLQHVPGNYRRITLELVLSGQEKPVPPIAAKAPEKPQEAPSESKRLALPPEGQSPAQRILGRLRGDR